MPTSTIWLKIGNADVRVYKQRVGNALLIQDPQLTELVDGEPVRECRVVDTSHWEIVGTGEELQVETILKDSKGNLIPVAKARCILEHTKNLAVNKKGETVDKKKIEYYLVNPDSSIGDPVAPYPPTERIEVKETPTEVQDQGDAYWVSSTMLEGFLIHEEYELPAADPRNDLKLWNEADAAIKRDEIAITTYSNGGFTQYYAFLVPMMKDGQFVWLLKISNKKVEYRCLRDVPGVKIPIRPVKTLETLPPIQALLTAPSAKKK
jgi:hypothetical protein